MTRLVVVIVVLAAAVAAFPQLRERAEPHAAEVWSWTLEKSEVPLAPALVRYRRAKAENQLSQTSRVLNNLRIEGRRLPEPPELAALLTRHRIAPEGRDPWGTPYRLQQLADSVAVSSAGPDRQFGTPDDLVVKVATSRRRR